MSAKEEIQVEYLQLIPVGFIDLLAGGLNYFNNPEGTIKRAEVVIFTRG
ncbi:hypothetical protein [Helicobacter ailurogastricus]|uniref:Uncharacterized protein n=1 Tax=Helicobacter ailurogastricus TaxID=1578720 RepID=A0A0K2XBR8_9HELI|nr:hypothetical protein [Helicobacter ailurogastricus]CRF41769.1 hypothetical protein HAL011_15840 [Helicobacter ailurogastricus]CRF42154.1 hypothetical protein HAL013_03130 [Helicobacter ailurogastricus]CRF43486.1 hypothetical protein HAL09_00270 [Helicobacter ailurogastricus]GLH58381.1 hypothetical protein NHP214376_11720 [Helicobacter ailurogastricus]GLH59505.1 hypothetical protein NHP214377_07730 [Helicobacter ailurogastricus]